MKKKLIIISSLVLFLLIVVGVLLFFLLGNKEVFKEAIDPSEDDYTHPPKKVVQIVDENSITRPIAVMINNHSTVQPYQSGLNDAYLVYEIIVEGGITRMMAVYKDANPERIGSVRSSRHYFLDYALENDALYAHHGWSPQAQSDISSLGINNLHGNFYWRESLPIDYEHTMFTSMAKLWEDATRYGYRTTSDSGTLLNYDAYEIEMDELAGNNSLSSVVIKYSSYQTNEWVYNSETEMFEKYSNGTLRTDYISGEAVSAKNIITYQVSNYSIDNYGRQDINNIGSGNGYFITNGYYIPITWTKDSRGGQTKYYYNDGTELIVNDGSTYIQIQPTTGSIEFKN